MVAAQPQQSTSKSKKTAVKQQPVAIPERKPKGFSDLFTSPALKGMVLLLIIVFNVMVLRNSFLLVAPAIVFSGDIQLDALLYGIAISTMMVIVLFQEENWENLFCPGAITLYLDTLILILYMKWVDWLIGSWWTLWLMGGLLILMPVMSLFILVLMLKNK
ncbi:MAG: hypothetical protein NZ519_03125 [Bacteroidia bacterium]|nr:hypothetical protein [Bacteroidia bacterium]MDW8300878.1 hypothetical protein [Bacteroidia bacterium]